MPDGSYILFLNKTNTYTNININKNKDVDNEYTDRKSCFSQKKNSCYKLFNIFNIFSKKKVTFKINTNFIN